MASSVVTMAETRGKLIEGEGDTVCATAKQGGRKTGKSNGAAGKKKQPQRGMGVAQLEKMRVLQERWKVMTEFGTEAVPLPHPAPTPFQIPHLLFPDPIVGVPLPKMGPAVSGYHGPPLWFQRVGFHGGAGSTAGEGALGSVHFQMCGSSGGVLETSRELSSMPKVPYQDLDDCGFCFKKKRMMSNSDHQMSGLNGERGAQYYFDQKHPHFINPVIDHEEYVFFPEKEGGCTRKLTGGEEEAQLVNAEAGSSDHIDLSLKL